MNAHIIITSNGLCRAFFPLDRAHHMVEGKAENYDDSSLQFLISRNQTEANTL